MASPKENKNGCETNQEGFQNQEGSSPVIEWSEDFQCFTVNGILAPVPLSAVPLETVVEDEHQESALSKGESSKKKRKTEGNEEFFYRLFKFPKAAEEYLLEIHEVKTGSIDRCHVFVHENNGRWKVGVYDLAPGDHFVVPVLQDPTPPIFYKKFDISLLERLTGWTVEKRKRGNGKEDKFYYHRARQFRSFVEVTTFILYSCKVKDLKITSTEKTSEVEEEEAAETMMIISSSNITTDRKSPEENSEKPDESNLSSMKSADNQVKIAEASQINEKPSIGTVEASNTASPLQHQKNEVILGEEKKELTDETETNQFIDYVSNIFEDDAPQTMNEIFGESKQLNDSS